MDSAFDDNGESATSGCGSTKSVFAQVQHCVAQVLKVDPVLILPNVTLLELGADSIDFVELVFSLERFYCITLPKSFMIADSHTVATYVDAVSTARAQRDGGE